MKFRHRTYADIHNGSDLYENIAPVDKSEAKSFRQHGKIFNVTRIHKQNSKILGQRVTNLSQARKNEKERLKKVKSR